MAKKNDTKQNGVSQEPVEEHRMPPAADREGENSTRITTQPIRLPRDIRGQNRTGRGHPN